MSQYNKLAVTICRGAAIREASYVHSNDGAGTYGDYTKDISQSCDEACPDDKQTSGLAYLLLTTAWNDAFDWAHKQLFPEEMAYVEALYSVALVGYRQDGDKVYDITSYEIAHICKSFGDAARSFRRTLYERPLPEAA